MANQQFHPVAKYLHWIIAALVVLQFVLAKVAENADTTHAELAVLANHKSVGITIFLLAVLRLAWRLRQGMPRALPMAEWQFIASRVSHWSMYALIFLLPLTGWLTSSAAAMSVSWFNLVPLPDLVAPDPKLEETLEEIHETNAKLLLVIAIIHIAAASWHTVRKDGALARITSPGPLFLFAAIIGAGSLFLTRADGDAGGVRTPVAPGDATNPAAWEIDYDASYIRFTASQAGTPVTGEWQEWHADLFFDGARLDGASIDVRIAVASVETLDDERDTVLQESEWFDGDDYPEVRYRASRFSQNADGTYVVSGALTVKGRNVPVPLHFTLRSDAGHYVLDGTATLARLALDLGTGEWSDTRWIGRFVDVTVHVEASPAD